MCEKKENRKGSNISNIDIIGVESTFLKNIQINSHKRRICYEELKYSSITIISIEYNKFQSLITDRTKWNMKNKDTGEPNAFVTYDSHDNAFQNVKWRFSLYGRNSLLSLFHLLWLILFPIQCSPDKIINYLKTFRHTIPR